MSMYCCLLYYNNHPLVEKKIKNPLIIKSAPKMATGSTLDEERLEAINNIYRSMLFQQPEYEGRYYDLVYTDSRDFFLRIMLFIFGIAVLGAMLFTRNRRKRIERHLQSLA